MVHRVTDQNDPDDKKNDLIVYQEITHQFNSSGTMADLVFRVY
jgi:hypothetical protein